MDVFSRPDYYPSPSSNVVKYREPDGFKGKRSILNADLVALVVDLSSPADAVDYTVISDFFLIYRNFMSSMQLQDLLVMRFRWCINEIITEVSKTKRRKVGEIALVRTFVLLRHWILNYFVQDFLVDVNLRLQLIKFLNMKMDEHPKIVRCTVINLKKAWVHCTKRVWTNLNLDEPKAIGEDVLWASYEIKDITELEEIRKRNSQLSSYAIQGSSSPNFRNRSVLSLYKSSDVFQLPIPSATDRRKRDNRTASMILFPQDNSNVKTVDTRKPVNPWPGTDTKTGSEMNSFNAQNNISRLSKLTKVSTAIKGVEYPSSPGIDKVMPPTPAKKVELILQLPDDSNDHLRNSNLQFSRNGSLRRSLSVGRAASLGRSTNARKSNTIGRSASTGRSGSVIRNSNFRTSMMHHGAVGLLSKWRKNHNYASRHDNEILTEKKENNYIKPEMDNFIKYVISISSLEDRNFAPEEMQNLVSSKFDLLSARTIEEVEHLVTLENNLIREVNETVAEDDIPSVIKQSIAENRAHVADTTEFSAMDNLNIYQTVNSIANSVFSLSKTLNQHKQQNNQQIVAASPSFAALERRRVQSAIPSMGIHSQSRLSINSQSLGKEGTPHLRDNGPQRLVFHGSARPDETKEANALGLSDGSFTATPTKSVRSPSPKRTCPSPSKEPLADVQEHHDLHLDSEHNDSSSTLSCVSYDSEFSTSNNNPILPGRRSRKLSLTYSNPNPSLKRKDAQPNLREFTFEDKDHLEEHDTCSMDSFVTTNEPEDENERISLNEANEAHEFTATTVRQASGRVSLAGRRTRVYSNARESMTSAGQRVIKDPDFLSKDKALHEKEMEMLELENDTTKRMSTTTSVDTNMLFSSTHGSPTRRRSIQSNRICLSATPSIRSVTSGRPASTREAVEKYDGNLNLPNTIDLTPQNKNKFGLQPQLSTDSSFNFSTSNDGGSHNDFGVAAGPGSKYLFSPDNESTDYASPAKNVEALKNKFFEDDNEDTFELESGRHEDTDSVKDCVEDNGLHHKVEGKSHNVERLLETIDGKQKEMPELAAPGTPNTIDWNNFSEDSVVDDPVNVALMKLEGTYKHGDGKANGPSRQKSSDSVLANEISMLGISDVASGQPDPKNKRKSLLIETRRQTIMNIPYTPTAEQGSLGKQENITFKAKDLLAQYEIKDPSLLVDNCGQHVPFILMYDSLSIAQQMTLIEKELLSEVDWKDLINVDLNYNGPPITSWLQLLVQNESMSGINLAIARFNLTVDWVISEIILTTDIKLKRNTIQRFIHVADHCRSFQNYNTLMEIVLALNSTAVQTFVEAWRLIEPGDLITWGELKKMPSLDRNYAYIRKLLNNINPIKGCAPFIVVYLSDLSLNSEKRTWIKDRQVVNYNKFETNVQIVKNFIQRVQWSKFYDFRVNHELLSKCVYLTALSHAEITQVIDKLTKQPLNIM